MKHYRGPLNVPKYLSRIFSKGWLSLNILNTTLVKNKIIVRNVVAYLFLNLLVNFMVIIINAEHVIFTFKLT